MMYLYISCTDYNVIPVTRTVYSMTVQHISYITTIKLMKESYQSLKLAAIYNDLLIQQYITIYTYKDISYSNVNKLTFHIRYIRNFRNDRLLATLVV